MPAPASHAACRRSLRAPPGQPELRLLELDGGAGPFELRLGLLGVFFADLLQHGLGGAVDQVLSFLEPEVRKGADLFDDLDLLVAGAGQDDVELVLFDLGRGLGGGGGRAGGGDGDGAAAVTPKRSSNALSSSDSSSTDMLEIASRMSSLEVVGIVCVLLGLADVGGYGLPRNGHEIAGLGSVEVRPGVRGAGRLAGQRRSGTARPGSGGGFCVAASGVWRLLRSGSASAVGAGSAAGGFCRGWSVGAPGASAAVTSLVVESSAARASVVVDLRALGASALAGVPGSGRLGLSSICLGRGLSGHVSLGSSLSGTSASVDASP